jgi:hypothetical protein
MAYRTMVRNGGIKKFWQKDFPTLENNLDQFLNEGTSQGWTLHKFEVTEWFASNGINFIFIWDTGE